MAQQRLHIQLPPGEYREDDQAVEIAPDVEHQQRIDQVGVGEVLPDGAKAIPIGALCGLIPRQRFLPDVLLFVLDKIHQARLADRVHYFRRFPEPSDFPLRSRFNPRLPIAFTNIY